MTQPVSIKTKRRVCASSPQRLSLWSSEEQEVDFTVISLHPSLVCRLYLRVQKLLSSSVESLREKGEAEEGGRSGGGEAVGPALPAPGPALAGNCNSSSGGKVSSAWLLLDSSGRLPLHG